MKLYAPLLLLTATMVLLVTPGASHGIHLSRQVNSFQRHRKDLVTGRIVFPGPCSGGRETSMSAQTARIVARNRWPFITHSLITSRILLLIPMLTVLLTPQTCLYRLRFGDGRLRPKAGRVCINLLMTCRSRVDPANSSHVILVFVA